MRQNNRKHGHDVPRYPEQENGQTEEIIVFIVQIVDPLFIEVKEGGEAHSYHICPAEE